MSAEEVAVRLFRPLRVAPALVDGGKPVMWFFPDLEHLPHSISAMSDGRFEGSVGLVSTSLHAAAAIETDRFRAFMAPMIDMRFLRRVAAGGVRL